MGMSAQEDEESQRPFCRDAQVLHCDLTSDRLTPDLPSDSRCSKQSVTLERLG
jgi:hypothetical protein